MRVASVSAAALALVPALARAVPQVVFDINWNLYVLGLNGKDYNAGAMNSWSSGMAFKELSEDGRPSFDTDNVQCWLYQYKNGAYCINADSSKPSDVYILDFASGAWTSIASNTTGTTTPDLNSIKVILDHDTNVFYGLDGANLFMMNMGSDLVPADQRTWSAVSSASFNTEGYSNPTIALASNHIHFIDVPGAAAGEANIFVIHFSYWQPEAQKYGDWQQEAGKTASIWKDDNTWQTEFWYVPDSGDHAYSIDVYTNATTTFDGPTVKDADATYTSSDRALVQLTSSGELYYLDRNATTPAWTQITNPVLSAAQSAASTSSSSTAASKTGSGSASESTQGSGGNNGAMGAFGGASALVTLGAVGLALAAFAL